jgi:hypothetical protein
MILAHHVSLHRSDSLWPQSTLGHVRRDYLLLQVIILVDWKFAVISSSSYSNSVSAISSTLSTFKGCQSQTSIAIQCSLNRGRQQKRYPPCSSSISQSSLTASAYAVMQNTIEYVVEGKTEISSRPTTSETSHVSQIEEFDKECEEVKRLFTASRRSSIFYRISYPLMLIC